MALKVDDISINTIIGNGTKIVGDLNINGFVRIDGDIDGNLETEGNVIIGDKARIRGNLKAKSAIIGGIVLGDIISVEGIKILSSAAVVGDIISKKVQIDDKATVHGHCISIRDDDLFKAESEKYLQSKAIKERVII